VAERSAFVLLGSNVEPERNLVLAARELRARGVEAFSNVTQTRAVGAGGQPDFLNAAARVQSDLTPEELRAIEAALGRRRGSVKHAPRCIDLDLVLFAPPDPLILTAAHVAVPLADLTPGLAHPVTGETLASIAARLRVGEPALPRPDLRL